jgi:hypothetical protein
LVAEELGGFLLHLMDLEIQVLSQVPHQLSQLVGVKEYRETHQAIAPTMMVDLGVEQDIFQDFI